MWRSGDPDQQLDSAELSQWVRDDLIPMSNRYTFIAGVLLGIAGGALIPFAQALLRSSATRATLGRPNETQRRRVEPESYDPLGAPGTVLLT